MPGVKKDFHLGEADFRMHLVRTNCDKFHTQLCERGSGGSDMTQTFRQTVASFEPTLSVLWLAMALPMRTQRKKIAATPATVFLPWSRILAIVGEEKRADPTVFACANIDRHGRNDQQ